MKYAPQLIELPDYTQAEETTLASSMTGQVAGKPIIYNTTLDKARRWNGSAFEDAPTMPASLVPPGPQGIQGIPGDQGIQGIQGIPGTQGIQGVPGNSSVTVLALASDATTNSTTSMVSITGLEMVVGPGTYVVQYFIRYQAALVTTGVKFAVDHSGTLTCFVGHNMFATTGGAAATAAASQAAAAATGNLIEGHGRRVKNTVFGVATVSVDAANSDCLMKIELIIIVTVSGTLKLLHGSEVAAASTVKAGTSLILTKTA